jgi:hypothetical protein
MANLIFDGPLKMEKKPQILRMNTDKKGNNPDPLSSVASVISVVQFFSLSFLTTDFTDEHR